MFFWNRPKPKFVRGDLLLRLNETRIGFRYIIVHRKRWEASNGKNDAQWAYDGMVIDAVEGEIFATTGVGYVLEKNLHRVNWNAPSKKLLDPRLTGLQVAQ